MAAVPPPPPRKPTTLVRPHKELRRGVLKKRPALSKIQRIAANLPKHTHPLQQVVGRANDHAVYLRTRQALIARESRGYEALSNPGARWQHLTNMQEEILRTLGEASGARLPIERGLY